MSLGPGLEPPSVASNAKATGTLKRPTSLSRHASAAGFPLSGTSTWTLGRSHRSPLSAASPAEAPIQGPCPDTVEDISHLLADVARFAEGLEKLKECVLRDGENWQGRQGLGGGRQGQPLKPRGSAQSWGRTWGGSEGSDWEGFVEKDIAARVLTGE